MVILDGCSTGRGTLPESFGIIHQENVPGSYYADASLRPSAFAGWSADKYVGFLEGAAVSWDHIYFIQLIQEYMALGNGIKTSVNMPAACLNVSGLCPANLRYSDVGI